MHMNRRGFLRNAGAMGTLAAAGAAAGCGSPASTTTAPARTLGKGLARNLTLLTFRDQGTDRLGAKTDKGILDVAQAASLLKMHAPASMDDLLQQEDGPSVQAVVEAAMRGSEAQAAFRPEEGIEYGPLVSRPDKIVCVGLNYRKHAEEIGSPVPDYRCCSASSTPAQSAQGRRQAAWISPRTSTTSGTRDRDEPPPA
jgi:hypothetical protein